MSMRSTLKRLFYRGAHLCRANAVFLASPWRSRRLLILCYHGVSLDDEHEWSSMYLPRDTFAARMEAIRRAGCAVLPLGQAIERLYTGSLPPRAAAITFDDGYHDFAVQAWPILSQFQYPATVYFPTYYALHNMPVFDPMCGYLLWKARGRRLSWPEMGIAAAAIDVPTAARLAEQLRVAALRRRYGALEKNALLRDLAGRLDIDFDALCARRILHLMQPDEAAAMARQGVDFELHCHRHRVYRSRDRMRRELQDNSQAIQDLTGQSATHFCYPGGFYLPEFPAWLAEFGIASATTCEAGLASPGSNRYELPRLLDTPGISPDAYSAWLSGLASFLPRTHWAPSAGQLAEDDPPAAG